jgi:DNA-binding response OmpR family regulator
MSDGTPPPSLLVDDEAAITSKLAPFLERAGFATDVIAGDNFAKCDRSLAQQEAHALHAQGW